jgi:transcriptional regulator with XRE-family HTH domain
LHKPRKILYYHDCDRKRKPGKAENVSFGDRLFEIRRKTGETQTAFAAKLGISQSALVTYERGLRDPPASALAALCEHFDVRAEWILNGSGVPFRSEDADLFKQVYWLEKKHPLAGAATEEERMQYRVLLHRYLLENGSISEAMIEALAGRKAVNE